ncbi:hypothetical protein [Brucella pseudogrignonensis]|uniref:Uncharacterized protein n=1 Tax=Brucella pseudogrignonensis TaxID=419475 RepID=A0ABU1MC37_9HYPH|nr:hypothetical protein [Brucella pseudogrignonensis]MDR6433370.1 hypothetical protein [Brucella pseudogrignonensis]
MTDAVIQRHLINPLRAASLKVHAMVTHERYAMLEKKRYQFHRDGLALYEDAKFAFCSIHALTSEKRS